MPLVFVDAAAAVTPMMRQRGVERARYGKRYALRDARWRGSIRAAVRAQSA